MHFVVSYLVKSVNQSQDINIALSKHLENNYYNLFVLVFLFFLPKILNNNLET